MEDSLTMCCVEYVHDHQLNTNTRDKMSSALLSDFQLSEGVKVEELSGELYEKFCSQMKSFAQGFVKLQPYNQMLPRCFLKYQKQIKEFQTRTDDVWVASFPKCGKSFSTLLGL